MAEFDEKNVKKTVIDLNALDYFYQCFHDIVLPRISVLAATSTIEEADGFNKDRIYMVPKAGTYAGYENLKPGDLLISDGTKWNVIPHADADSGIKFYGIQLVVNSAEQICYIEKDGVIQTYDLIKAAYESQTDFLFLEYNSRIYLPTIKNGDIIFNTTSIDSIDNVSYSNNYQITVSSDKGVTISSITSESIENKITSLEGWTTDQLTHVYPTADAVVKAINAQKVAITETSEEGSDGTFLVSTGDADPIEIKIKGLNNAAYKDIDASIDDTLETLSENLPTSKAVVEYIKTEFGNMTEPMVYEGTVGNGGDIETLPEDTSTIKNGATYKVISKMTVGDITAKSGDVFIWNDKGSVGKWDYIPSADEINTLETVKINGVALEPDSDKAVNISISTDAEKNGILIVNDEDLPVYEHPTGEGFNHIPEGGTVGQILVNDAEGSVKWDDIPNASLTMQKNGETIGTFTSNASEDVEINIELGDAADMGVDTELSEESTDENVPTSKTVYEAVEVSKIAENNSYDNSNSGLIAEDVQSAIDETMSKIKDIELFKFPNATIIGTPTINNGQVSGFSISNYMKFPFIVNMQGRPFVIDMAFTTGSEVTSQQNIIDGLDHGIAFAIRDGKFIIVLSSKSGEWDISNGERVSDQIVTGNTSYRVRLSWNGSVYTFEYSTNGETYAEVTSMRVVSSLSLYPTQINIGVTSGLGGIFKGIINMNYCSLTISNKVVWTGMDDVGLATRMAVDMSNIDEAGENKVRSIIGDLPTKESLELDNVTNDKQVKGLETGTTAGHLVSWGSDGYTVTDTGATIINTDINVEADKDNVPTAGAVKTAIESATSGMQKCLGTINSLTELNTEAKIGNYYRVKTAWETDDIDVHVSDVLIAEKDNPEQKIDGENWSLLHNEMDTDTTYQFQSGTTNGNFQFKSSSESSWNDISIYGLNDAAYMPTETSITEGSDDNMLPTSKAVVDYITKEITGLTKVESSEINGNIKIDDVETSVYEHPTQTSKPSGMYKITIDKTGHVNDTVNATAIDLPFNNVDTQIASEDVQGAIVESFIPVYTQSEFESIRDDIRVGQKFIISDDQNEHGGGGASSADKVSYDNTSSGLTASDVQTVIDELTENKANKTEISSLENELANKANKSYTDDELAKKADKEEVYTKTQTDKAITDKIAEIIAGAPEDFDTLKEMSDWINDHEESAAAMNTAIQSRVGAPQTAEVGQILAVKDVDENGRPTEWECVPNVKYQLDGTTLTISTIGGD